MSESRNKSVAGLKWGDEGKGKVTDEASQDAEYVVRAEGGANAGHTIMSGDTKFVGHLVPSGAVAGAKCMLARGVRVDLEQFFDELDDLSKMGITPQIWIDGGAFINFEWHKALEFWAELSKGSRRAYTTMRGMCSTAAAIGLRVNPKAIMLLRPDELLCWLKDFYKVFKPIFTSPILLENVEFKKAVGIVQTPEAMLEILLGYAPKIEKHLLDVRATLYGAWTEGKPILFEGAQGLLLDPYWGPTHGCNTQGICSFAGIAVGTGLPTEVLGQKIGVIKAIDTRVGNGGFPTELGEDTITNKEGPISGTQEEAWLHEMLLKINNGHANDQEIGQYFRVVGKEYGATTGRPRRTGWLDLAATLYSVQVNGPHELALTKLDCLSGVKRLMLGVAYQMSDGSELPLGQLPELACDFDSLTPKFQEIDGWSDDITGETSFESLPENAQNYVLRVERFLRRPITIIGTGPKREHVIRRESSL